MRLLLLTFFLCPVHVLADLRLNELEPKIDAFVQAYQPVENTGIAVGIVKDGSLVFFKGYGYRDRGKKLPVTRDTLFAIGSVTKSFLSTAIAINKEESDLSYDLPLAGYLPGFSLENPEAAEKATLRDLLSHQVGLPRHDLLWYLTPFTSGELFSKLAFLETDKRPGMGFRSGKMQYNNLMFMTAGLLLEKRTGRPWKDFVRERILRPLGMNSTGFSTGDFVSAAEPALPYAKEEAMPYKSLEGISAAGAMNSTVNDLAEWVGLHLRRGADPAGRSILSPSGLKRLYQWESDASIPEKKIEMGYGLGIMLSPVKGRMIPWHGGNIDGFSSHVSFLPEEGIGLIILVNQNGAGNFQFPFEVPVGGDRPPVKLLPLIIYEHLLGGAGPAQPAPVPGLEAAMAGLKVGDFNPESPKAMADSAFLRRAGSRDYSAFTGDYLERAYEKVTASVDTDGTLVLSYFEHRFFLEPTDVPGEFEMLYGEARQPMGLKAEFEMENGRAKAVKIPFEPAVSPIVFRAVRN